MVLISFIQFNLKLSSNFLIIISARCSAMHSVAKLEKRSEIGSFLGLVWVYLITVFVITIGCED